MNELGRAIAAHIRATGPIGFDEYVGHALYTPGLGFYAGGGGAGRRRDFLTSPEVGPIFGAVVANALDQWWDDAGQPARFPVVEVGAGPGTLARTVLAATPRCLEALQLVLVEPAQTQWATHPEGVTSRAALPEPGALGAGPVVVLANELLDNLPFGLVELTSDGWAEILVGVNEEGDELVEVHSPLSPRRAGWCRSWAGGDASVGTRLPVQADAAVWLSSALELAGAGGHVLIFDYADTISALAERPWTDWVRTYAAHGRAGHPLDAPGTCDITVEVAVDQLAMVAPPDEDRTQADWLRAHGIDAFVDEGRRIWHELGMAGGLKAIAARSRVHEADALLDPAGLGSFRALEWHPTL